MVSRRKKDGSCVLGSDDDEGGGEQRGSWRKRRTRRYERPSNGEMEQEQEEDHSDPRSGRLSMRPATVSLSRVHSCNGQPHTLGYITRRDLYSRLTSLCEGRIRSDTSLVCTRTVRLCSLSLSPSLSLSLSLSLSFSSLFFCLIRSPVFFRVYSSVGSSGGFACNDSHPALSTLPSSSRLHEDPIRRL